MGEILTVQEVAALLKMSKRQVYTMCETRTREGSMKDHPLPVLKINGNLRFRKADVDSWIAQLCRGESCVSRYNPEPWKDHRLGYRHDRHIWIPFHEQTE
jgi:excisionase family DNA binding protein